MATYDRLKSLLLRDREKLKDASLLAATMVVVAYILIEVDVFAGAHAGPARRAIEVEEMPILGAVLCVGMLFFAWRRSQEQRRETQRRIAAERHIRELAFEDPLTGIPNRRRFQEKLASLVESPPRMEGAHALLMLDLNGFKNVNDVYGHPAGDETLVAVAQRLRELLRPGDLVARLGGDEFALLCEQLSGAEAATSVAIRIIESLAKPVRVGAADHVIGAGIGICLIPFEGVTPEETLRRADVALYRAKAEGKSAFRYFDEEMDRLGRERTQVERELRLAIAHHDIQPFFQPLVDLKTNEIVGFEALARWTHADMGVIPPDRFIPIAEDTGLIRELTDSLFRAACEAACHWPSRVILAFNISPVQLKDTSLGLRIMKILGDTGLVPGRLEIEITESALVRDWEAAKEVLGSLRTAGIRIALDDFGTGYSSLYHLRNFKVDKIKIDRSFVHNMGTERESAEIVSALVGLGNGLGLTITAEGIEDPLEQAALVSKGCGQGQGYLFGKAMSGDDALRLFTSDQRRAAG